jgi:DDB1- and CUL4-associated factor 15
MIKKRLTNTSDEDSDADENLRAKPAKARKKRGILTKILNREKSGFFNCSANAKSNSQIFSNESVLKFCLKDIIPFRYLNDHIFMGLSSCGNFLISYKRISCENESTLNYDFNSGYKYELFFWVYRPHMALSRYVRRPFISTFH